jgi:hypothetical protein
MTKLAYDYGTPENAAAVRRTRAKLPPTVGSHIADKQGRAKYREGYAASQAFGIKAQLAVAEMMEYVSKRLPQVDPDGMVEFFGREFEHFGAGLVDASRDEDNDVIGDLIEWNHRHKDPAYRGEEVSLATKLAKYESAELLMTPHYSDGKPTPQLIYDYDSEDNNETVALYLTHPDIANKGDHIPEADNKPYDPVVADFDVRAAYREGYAAAKAFGVRVHLGTMVLATPPRPGMKPSMLKKYSRASKDTQLRVFFRSDRWCRRFDRQRDPLRHDLQDR